MIADSRHCCCMDVKTCGMIVGVFGTIFGILVCISSFGSAVTFPAALFLLSSYVLILFGIHNKNSSCLLTAEIFLGFQIVLHIISASFIIFCLAFGAPDITMWMYKKVTKKPYFMYAVNYEEFSEWAQITVISLVVTVVLMSSFLAYSCIVVLRVRQLFEEEKAPERSLPQQYNMPQPVHVNLYGIHVPQQQPLQVPQQTVPSAPPQEYHQGSPPMSYTVPPHLHQGYPTPTTLYPHIYNVNTPSYPSQ